MRISADEWYSENALVTGLGVGLTTQRKAREGGGLKFSQSPAGAIVYRGSDVEAWLKAGMPVTTVEDGKKAAAPPRANGGGNARASVPANTIGAEAVPERIITMQQRSKESDERVVKAFEAEVARRMVAGASRSDALLAISKETPGLREAYVEAHNRLEGHGRR